MNFLHALILGLIQGLTEFLPVSSSGHLALAEKLFGLSGDNLRFEVFVHLGTLLAVLVFFRNKVWKLARSVLKGRIYYQKGWRFSDDNLRISLLLILATIPAAFIGYKFDDAIEQAFASPAAVSAFLIVTGAILFVTRFVKKHDAKVNWWRALVVGLAQAAAILPGISRSGSTICAGIFCRLEQEKAAEFSFLLSIPIILGAGVVKLKDMLEAGVPAGEWAAIFAGAAVAAVSGYFAIAFLLKVLKKGKLEYFAYYCWVVGIMGLVRFGLMR
jgi:undecaprenyl-diphosphatase